jgi:polysaccharide export outer membrane protein
MLMTLFVLWMQGGPPAARGGEYVIGPKDVIAITIFNEEALSRPALTVDAEGTVECPHIGRVRLAGLTTRQAEDLLVARYSQGWLVNPSISVEVKQHRNMSVWVLGQVKSPAQVELKGDATLMAALAAAGNLTNDAGSYIIITRAPEGAEAGGPTLPDEHSTHNQVRVPREDVEMGRAAAIRLRAGDTVFVPKAESFYVSGEVKNAGPYVHSEGLTLLQAITMAGGLTDRAAKNRIEVNRTVNGRTVKVKLKENDPILPNDTIVVPRRFF